MAQLNKPNLEKAFYRKFCNFKTINDLFLIKPAGLIISGSNILTIERYYY